jgi:hypothetical protein
VEVEAGVARTVQRVVNELLDNDQISATDIVVLTPSELAFSPLCGRPLTHGRKLTPHPKPNVNVRLAPIEEFKGLECAVVVLAEAERLPKEPGIRFRYCYTAFSRARSHLIVLGDWSTKSHLIPGHENE